MSKAPRTAPTERITGPDWDEGEYAVVRTYLSGLDRQRIRDASTRQNPETGESHADAAGGVLAMLRAGIADWRITYADGTQIPLSEEGFSALPASYLSYILTTLTELWAAWERPAPEPKPGQTPEAAAKQANFPAAQVNGRRPTGEGQRTRAAG